jgi:flavin-dependent dehydrogenase
MVPSPDLVRVSQRRPSSLAASVAGDLLAVVIRIRPVPASARSSRQDSQKTVLSAPLSDGQPFGGQIKDTGVGGKHNITHLDADVIVIGGGPAGATLGCYLAQAGLRTILIERENHPRPHVGESLVNATTRIFNDIGFLETMERERFVHKYGGTWTGFQGRDVNSDIRFVRLPQDGVTQPYSYHVDRAHFDALLFKHAEQAGTTNIQGANVLSVTFDDANRATGVVVRVLDREFALRSRFVVDASGRKTMLGNQLRLKQSDPAFDQFAIHSWFTGVQRREDDTRNFIRIFFLPYQRGWVWQIPITEEITSVGVVTEKSAFRHVSRDPDAFFARAVSANTTLAASMQAAERIRPYTKEGDYSYSMRRFAGSGWLLVGDACRFVDPIFSSGVSVAMYSAKFASEAIVAALEGEERPAFAAYEARVARGVNIWYEFISLYYRMMYLFTWFARSSDEYQMDLIRLLQGLVFDREEVKLLDVWKNMIVSIEQNPRHLLHKELMSLAADGRDGTNRHLRATGSLT